SRVRRDDDVHTVAPGETLRISSEGVERIRVDDEWNACAFEESVYEGRGTGRLSETRTDGNDVGLEVEDAIERGKIDGAGNRFLQAFGHVLGCHRRDDWEARARRRHGDETRARTKRAHGREVRRTGAPDRPCDHEHPPEIPLVRIGR